VAKVAFKVITVTANFNYDYDIATYSVTINQSCVGNSVAPK